MDRLKFRLRLYIRRLAPEVRKQVQRTKSFLRRSRIWLRRDVLSETLFLNLALVPVGTVALSAWFTNDWLVVSGFALQVLGSCLVLYHVFRFGLLSGNDPVPDRFRSWVTHVRRWGTPQHHVLEVKSTLSLGASVSAELTVGAGPDASVERRIEVLEEDIKRLRKLINQNKNEILESVEKLRTEFKKHVEKVDNRAREEALLAKEVRTLSDMELCAVVWLLIGLLLSNLPVVLGSF